MNSDEVTTHGGNMNDVLTPPPDLSPQWKEKWLALKQAQSTVTLHPSEFDYLISTIFRLITANYATITSEFQLIAGNPAEARKHALESLQNTHTALNNMNTLMISIVNRGQADGK
jgi:hypothetical protein